MPPDTRHDGERILYFCNRCGYPCVYGTQQDFCGVPTACERRLGDPTYRVPHDRLAAVEVDMREFLIQRVRNAGTGQPSAAVITYADLTAVIDPQRRYWSWAPPDYRGLSKALERISTFERAHGRPSLSALVAAGDARRLAPSSLAQIEEMERYWRVSGPSGPSAPPAGSSPKADRGVSRQPGGWEAQETV